MLLRPEDYYTQRNNKLNPESACMNTSRVMFYKAAGISYTQSDSGLADDDYFMQLLQSEEAEQFALKKYPWAKDVPVNEIHGMYGSWLDEKVTGKRRTDFKTNLTWHDFVRELSNGRPVMTSGRFIGIPGHAFVFIGYSKGSLIAADPWGDPHSRYRSTKGYGIPYDQEYFEAHVKPGEYKWGHLLL